MAESLMDAAPAPAPALAKQFFPGQGNPKYWIVMRVAVFLEEGTSDTGWGLGWLGHM